MTTMSLIIIGVVILLLVVFILVSYVKAPPSQAFIISGLSKEPRVLIGKGGIKIPLFERLDRIYLGQITVDIKTETSIPTNDFINVDVDAVAKIRVKPTEDGIRLAGKNFLNMTPDMISRQLQDSLQGNMREIIGTITLKELNTNRDGFSDQVMEKAAPDMEKLGIEILSCNIQNITDKNGLIQDLGADNVANIKKTAAITKADAEAEISIRTSEANQKANDARVESERRIAEKNNELAIKKSELKKAEETKRAEADMAYEIQKQEQQKALNIKQVDADIEKAKREQVLTQEKITIKENELRSSVNKTVEAEKYKIEKESEASKFRTELDAAADLERRKRNAEAEKYEAEQKALAIQAEANAKKYSMLAEAEGIKAKGEAEAYSIELKGKAEAEAMDKKAEAYKKYNGAAMVEMIVGILPQMASEVAKPLSSIDSVNIYGTGQGGEVSSLSGNVPVVIKQVFDTVSKATGIDMKEVLKAGTIEAATTKNINLNSEASEVVEGLTEGTKEKK